jgi:hypothetical protein
MKTCKFCGIEFDHSDRTKFCSQDCFKRNDVVREMTSTVAAPRATKHTQNYAEIKQRPLNRYLMPALPRTSRGPATPNFAVPELPSRVTMQDTPLKTDRVYDWRLSAHV